VNRSVLLHAFRRSSWPRAPGAGRLAT